MLLPLDVVALRLIEDEGVAEVGDVASDGDVVGGNPVGVEDVDDVVGELRLPELSIMYSASLSNTVESVRIVVYPSHHQLLLGFKTRVF